MEIFVRYIIVKGAGSLDRTTLKVRRQFLETCSCGVWWKQDFIVDMGTLSTKDD